VSPAKTAEAIEMPFASTTLVCSGKHLLHIADRFGRILYCVNSTQYSLPVHYYLFQLPVSDEVTSDNRHGLIFSTWSGFSAERSLAVCYANFLKVPRNKNERRKTQISPNLAPDRNILSAVSHS